MDWGDTAPFVTFGNISAAEVNNSDADAFILISPQNVTGHSIMPFLEEMAAAAEAQNKPVILINPKLGDIPASGGVMGVRGRQGRQDFVATFQTCYHFRLLYLGAAMYPIMGAMRHTWGQGWEVYKRVVMPGSNPPERYELIGSFDHEPGPAVITETFKTASLKK
jgi:adenylate kinase